MLPLILTLAIQPGPGLALAAAPIVQEQSAAERIDALLEAYEAEYDVWRKQLRSAESDEERQAIYDENPSGKTAEALAKLVKEAEPTSAQAFKAHAFIVQNATGESMEASLDSLAANFLNDDKLADVVPSVRVMGEAPKQAAFLRTLLGKSESAKVQATACYQLASGLKYTLDRMSPEPAEAARIEKEAIGLYEMGLEKFADAKLRRGTFGELAEKDLFELRNLIPGKTAPDIDGEDLAGTAFKLSDYRGKVVMLDFWGDW